MDLSSLSTLRQSTAGVSMPVRHPITGATVMQEGADGSPTDKPVTLLLRGVDAPEFQSERKAILDRRISDAANAPKGKMKVPAAEMERDALELLVKCTINWEGVIYEGAPLAFSEANARKLYISLPWLREQADAFTENRANFLGNS